MPLIRQLGRIGQQDPGALPPGPPKGHNALDPVNFGFGERRTDHTLTITPLGPPFTKPELMDFKGFAFDGVPRGKAPWPFLPIIAQAIGLAA
ncbi:MAG: hypothetical protein B7Z78_08620 [Rhodospirillales bacterium 20-60-12]|nr:MAG: hypothetical protein B7Z78_08620 [Rhodospirillales bacterium 20-60-12]